MGLWFKVRSLWLRVEGLGFQDKALRFRFKGFGVRTLWGSVEGRGATCAIKSSNCPNVGWKFSDGRPSLPPSTRKSGRLAQVRDKSGRLEYFRGRSGRLEFRATRCVYDTSATGNPVEIRAFTMSSGDDQGV